MLFNGIESVEFIFIFTLPSAFEDVTLDYFVSCVLRAREREKFHYCEENFLRVFGEKQFFCLCEKREKKKYLNGKKRNKDKGNFPESKQV